MAGKIVNMSKIKQVLLMNASGVSNRQIATTLGIDKGTVNNYIRKFKSGNMDIEELLQLDEPQLESRFIAGTAAYPDKRFEDFKELLPHFEKELERKHVTRQQIWSEYLEKYPSGYRYTQFCFHLNQQLVARNPSGILTHISGEKLFVDFAGDKLEYINMITGEIVSVHVFVGCLPFSDYTFIIGVLHQTTEDFLYALACCLKHLGGSPQIVVPDNLKAAVIKADRYEPDLNRLMADFANHYGFAVMPTRAARPKDKAKVENHVRIIYSRVYAKLRNNRFFSLDELNSALFEKCMEHNQTRMQQKDYSRMEKFLADEKPLLRPLPQTDFEIKYYANLRVGQNCCVFLGRDKHYYSVPYKYIGQKAFVVYTRTLVKIFCKNELVATHKRNLNYGYTTVADHLGSSHQYYNQRSPEYYIGEAEKKSSVFAQVVKEIFNGNNAPELLYRQCDGLLSLYRKTDNELFEKACHTALKERVCTYKFIKSLVEGKMQFTEEEEYKPLPFPNGNIRGKQYYK